VEQSDGKQEEIEAGSKVLVNAMLALAN